MIDLLALLGGLVVGVLGAVAVAGLSGGRSPVRMPGPAPQPSRAPAPSAGHGQPAPSIRVNRPGTAGGAGATAAATAGAPPRATSVRARLTPSDGTPPVDLGDEIITLGRGTDQRLRIADSRASRAHAVVRPRAQGGWELKDAGSSNGTLLNGHAIPADRVAPLRDGDRIGIGPVTISYSETFDDPPPSDPGPPPGPDATRVM